MESDGGMHCVYLLDKHINDIMLCNDANDLGLGIQLLSHYYSGVKKLSGLVIGFAGYNESEQVRAITLLSTVIRNAKFNG